MSHRRIKRLRAAFVGRHGRAPRKAEWSDGDAVVQVPGGYARAPRVVIVQDELRQFGKEQGNGG